jgi:DNA repair exonuclease SbcCD ATPase subunit
MNLSFKQIILHNFLSYRGVHDLDFIDLGTGLHFLRGQNQANPKLGANDSGKSTLFAALSWAIFGKTPAGQKNIDVRPWTGEKNTTVIVEFSIDKENHTIERSIGPNFVKLDDEVVDQDQIDRLLRLNYEVFSQTVLLGQGKPLFFDLEPRAKMELFGAVLDLERWDEYSKKASDQTKELEQKHLEFSSDLRSTDIALGNTTKTLEAVSHNAETWSDNRQARIEDGLKTIAKDRKELKRIQDIKDKADLDYDGASVQIKLLQAETNDIAKQMLDMARDAEIVELKVMESKHTDLMRTLKSFDREERCPTCGQSIKRADFGKHKKELHDKISDLERKIASLKKTLDKTQTKFDELQKTAICINKSLESFQKQVTEAQSQIRISAPDVARLETSIRSLNERIRQWKDETNPYHEQVQQLKRQRTELSVRVKNINKDLDKIEIDISHSKFWIKGFKDIKLYIIDEVMRELELTTNSMLPDFGLDDWSVCYDIEKETKSGTISRAINVEILSPNNKAAVPWSSWGGGVGQRLRIISALALSQVLLNYAGVNPNLEILDEQTRSLSSTGVRDLCDYLAWRADNLKKIIILVDHKVIESSQFQSIITAVKDKNGSFIHA